MTKDPWADLVDVTKAAPAAPSTRPASQSGGDNAPDPFADLVDTSQATTAQPATPAAWTKVPKDANGLPRIDLMRPKSLQAPQAVIGGRMNLPGQTTNYDRLNDATNRDGLFGGAIDVAAGLDQPEVSRHLNGDIQVTYPDGQSELFPNEEEYAKEMFARTYSKSMPWEDYKRAYVAQFGGTTDDVPTGLVVDVYGSPEGAPQEQGDIPGRNNAGGQADAFVRHAANAATAGLADYAEAGLDTLVGDKSFAENLREQHRINEQDMHNRTLASVGGMVAGTLLLPSGVKGSAHDAGLAAGTRVLREGGTMAEARTAAATAARKAAGTRMAGEGAAYGAVSGATSEDNPNDAWKGGLTGGVSGAVLGKGIGELGRLAPVVTGARNGFRSMVDAGRKVIASVTNEGALDNAGGLIARSTTRPIGDIVSSIENRAPSVAGVQPTLAEVAADPSIAGFQRGFGNTDMAGAAALSGRNASNALARTDAAVETLGDGSPQSLQDFAAGQLSAAERATAEQRAAREAAAQSRLDADRQAAFARSGLAETGLADQQAAIGPVADRSATGAATRQVFDEAYEAAKAKTRDAYGAPILKKPIAINIPRPVFAKVREAADDFYGDGGGEIPAQLQSVISDMADPNATTRTLTNIDRRLADFAGQARMAGRASEGAFAERLRSTLGDFVATGTPKPYRDALANAKAVRAEQGRLFETGAPSSAFARDRYGLPVVGDTSVPSRIVRPGAAGGDTIDSLIASIGPNAAEQVAREELRRAVDEGNITTAAQADRLATRFGEVAKRFPQLQADLSRLRQSAAELEASNAAETAAQRAGPTADEQAAIGEKSALHQQILASPLGKVADPTVDPSAFVGQLIRRSDNGRQLGVLINSVKGDESARNGLLRALGDFIEEMGAGSTFTAAGDRVPAINKTRTAIALVVKRAGDALTTQQKIVLQNIRRELESASFAATASKPPGSETAINRSFSEALDAAPFVPSKAKSVLSTIYQFLGNGQQVKGLVNRALLDPDFAATLLKRPTVQHWEEVRRAVRPVNLGRVRPPVALTSNVIDFPRRIQSGFSSASTKVAADEPIDETSDGQGNAGDQYPQDYRLQP